MGDGREGNNVKEVNTGGLESKIQIRVVFFEVKAIGVDRNGQLQENSSGGLSVCASEEASEVTPYFVRAPSPRDSSSSSSNAVSNHGPQGWPLVAMTSLHHPCTCRLRLQFTPPKTFACTSNSLLGE